MHILEGLNERQKDVVLATDGPLLVVAGAGSGKTKTITHRIAHLIQKGTRPEHILAVTFTNKAAGEMKERVIQLLAREHIQTAELPFMGTFHALGVYILKQHGSAIGINQRFTILDTEDVRSIIKDLIKEFQLDPESFPPQRIYGSISRLKNDLMDADAFAEENDNDPYQQKLRMLYTAYEARLKKNNSLDFDDLLLKPVLLLQKSETAREHYRNRWSYIHIDEYQDTNKAQYVLSRILSEKHDNIAVVGDVDQAIYSWRGADWRNIIQFELDFPEVQVITLEENYRSTQKILDAANAVIEHNTERKEKVLRTTNDEGDSLQIMTLNDERQEGLFITEFIKAQIEDGVSPQNIAVLFRTNAQSRALEEAFLKQNMPYRLISGVKFYERKEIKDIVAFLKYALNDDDLVSKTRIVNTPPRGIGKVTGLKYLGGSTLSEREQAKVAVFEDIMKKIRIAIETTPATTVIKTIMKDAGFDAYYKKTSHEEDRLENVKELLSVAQKFDTEQPPHGIEKFLMEVSLATEEERIDTADGATTLLTAHSAKGLEYDIVVIAGMEEGLFPHSLSQEPSEIEEERRLFYVALTRARKKILITLTDHRMIFGDVVYNEPSRFLSEIPEELTSSFDVSGGDQEFDSSKPEYIDYREDTIEF